MKGSIGTIIVRNLYKVHLISFTPDGSSDFTIFVRLLLNNSVADRFEFPLQIHSFCARSEAFEISGNQATVQFAALNELNRPVDF